MDNYKIDTEHSKRIDSAAGQFSAYLNPIFFNAVRASFVDGAKSEHEYLQKNVIAKLNTKIFELEKEAQSLKSLWIIVDEKWKHLLTESEREHLENILSSFKSKTTNE